MVNVNKTIKAIVSYKPGKPIEEVRRQLGIKDIIKLASNENAFGPSPKALIEIKRASGNINRYPESSCYKLRGALSKKLKINPKNLCFGNGSDEIIDIIIKAFCGVNEEVLTADKTFLEYKIIAQQNGREVKIAALENFTYDLPAIKAAVGPKTGVIFIANPNNPTGTYVCKDEVEKFLKSIPSNIIVVFDEAYFEYVDTSDFPRSLDYIKKGKNIIILRTFSKIYGLAGLRIGYAIAKEGLTKYMERARQPFNVNSLAQAAAIGALEDTAFLKMCKERLIEGKKYIYGELDKMGINYLPSEANFILIDLKKNSGRVFSGMLKKGVIVRDLMQYGLNNFIRVTIGTKKENQRFIQVFKECI